MFKIDHRKILNPLYHPSCKILTIVDIPPMNFLMVDGCGKPDGKQFPQAASILYPLAYTIKWMIRLENDIDFHVMPMEVLWKVNREKKEFAWTMMLMQPEYVTAEVVTRASQKVQSKVDAALLKKVRFESFAEGMCVQFLHIGPYEGMEASLEKMLAFAFTKGFTAPVRNTHDIYLNDVRKTKPDNLKAIMRLPVKSLNKNMVNSE